MTSQQRCWRFRLFVNCRYFGCRAKHAAFFSCSFTVLFWTLWSLMAVFSLVCFIYGAVVIAQDYKFNRQLWPARCQVMASELSTARTCTYDLMTIVDSGIAASSIFNITTCAARKMTCASVGTIIPCYANQSQIVCALKKPIVAIVLFAVSVIFWSLNIVWLLYLVVKWICHAMNSMDKIDRVYFADIDQPKLNTTPAKARHF